MRRRLIVPTLALTVVFLGLAIHRCGNFVDDVSETTAQGEDWLVYRQNAMSIVEDGIRMPAVTGNYWRPGGFLYNYFVAAVFAATRPNSSYVYVVQAALLALSVGVMAAAFSPWLSAGALWCFAIALAGTAYLDAFRYYTFRLLSENLLLFCLAGWWLSITAAIRRPSSAALFGVSGIVLGLCALARPNLMPLGPIVCAVLFWRLKRDRLEPRAILMFAAGFLACTSLILVRNFAVTGQIDLSVLTSSRGWQHPSGGVLAAAQFYVRRALFSVGFLSLLDAAYSVRPHWLLAWAGLVSFVVVRRRDRLELWELLVLTFIATYLLPLIAVADISNYGYRMIFPVVPAVILLALRSVDLRLGHA